MPAYEKKPMGGDEDMYESGSDAPAPKPEDKSPEDSDKEKEAGQTALVPESLCPGMKPGEEMVVKIKSVMDGQYEVEYSPEPEHKEETPEKAPAPEGDPEMAGMME